MERGVGRYPSSDPPLAGHLLPQGEKDLCVWFQLESNIISIPTPLAGEGGLRAAEVG